MPAALAWQDGVPYAEHFGDVYHSADGGLEQARHVFIGGNELPQRWRGRERFAILETGFGLGLNFLATWQRWQDDPERCPRLHYTAIEKHPFHPDDLARLHALWPELGALSAELLAAWPPLVPGFHHIELAQGKVLLTLAFGDVAHCLPQVDAGAGFDAFYLDGFAPSKNPDMWAGGTLAGLRHLAAPEATAATYTVAAAVREALAQAGFVCEKRPGFGRKRDMLAARYAPRWPLRQFAAPVRHAIVLGAGLAGCAISERLCARGWQVTLIERHAEPAQEISGNRAGIVLPRLSQDDNPPSRIARAAYLYALDMWKRLGGIGAAFEGEACGVLQLANDAAEARAQDNAAGLFAAAPEFVQWLDGGQIDARFGIAGTPGGWLFEQGGWVAPGSFCAALLAACGERLERRFGTEIAGIHRAQGNWEALDAGGKAIAAAPYLIVAGGHGAGRLEQAAALPLGQVRGQVTHLPAGVLPVLPLVVCGAGYMTRPRHGIVSIGATYDTDADPHLRADSQRANLQALARMLPGLAARIAELDAVSNGQQVEGRVGFRCVTPDRLPLVGALPDMHATIRGSRLRDVPRLSGLYGLLGYGSRGLTWAPFCAELLAAQIEGEPLPLEKDLVAALDPARFSLKAHRRARTSL